MGKGVRKAVFPHEKSLREEEEYHPRHQVYGYLQYVETLFVSLHQYVFLCPVAGSWFLMFYDSIFLCPMACPGAMCGLFVSECFDGVHACCFPGGHVSEEDSYECTHTEAYTHTPEGYIAG